MSHSESDPCSNELEILLPTRDMLLVASVSQVMRGCRHGVVSWLRRLSVHANGQRTFPWFTYI